MGFARFFVVALLVMGLFAAGVVGAQRAFVAGSTRGTSCEPLLDVAAVAGTRTEQREAFDDTVRRVVSLVAPAESAGPADVGRVVICVASGDLTIRASRDGTARLTFTVESSGFWSGRAVDDTRVEPFLALEDGVWLVGAHQVREGLRVPFLTVQGAKAHVTLELPASTVWAIDAKTLVGRISVEGLPVSRANLEAGVGDIRFRSPQLDGNLSLKARVGTLDVAAASQGPGRMDLHTDAGDIKVLLPASGVPLDLHALTNVGRPLIDVPGADAAPLLKRGNGAEASARSVDLVPGAPRVFVDASTRVGDVTLIGA